jgi:anthranilate phosphoribosyltransferase
VHGHGGLDELSLAGPTIGFAVEGGRVREHELLPSDFGLTARPAPLAGGDAATNAHLLERLFAPAKNGADSDPALIDLADAVILNAAAALELAGLAPDSRRAALLARETLASGAARDRLAELKTFTRTLAAAEAGGATPR